MHWFAVMAAAAFTKKLIMRYRRGLDVQRILEDPVEIRTLARFELDAPAYARLVLEDIGEALTPHLPSWVATNEALTVRRGARVPIDVVKLVARDVRVYTLELTRAWTGPALDASARHVLAQIHGVLEAHPAVRGLAWHGRQDRELTVAFEFPLAAMP